MSLARFMASPLGRAARIVAGCVLIAIGLTVGGSAGTIVAVVGLVPLIAGVVNVCWIAPLIDAPFKGEDVAK